MQLLLFPDDEPEPPEAKASTHRRISDPLDRIQCEAQQELRKATEEVRREEPPLHPRELAPSPAPFLIARGEKDKARDILAAVRTLKTIEQERRAAMPEECTTLGRFGGFGPVALSVFPDPVTGRYKDASWQATGEELKSLLTPEEYASAKRTTFNAFYWV